MGSDSTVCTSDLLDLIQEDVLLKTDNSNNGGISNRMSSSGGRRINDTPPRSGGSGSGSGSTKGKGRTQQHHRPTPATNFRVRLTPSNNHMNHSNNNNSTSGRRNSNHSTCSVDDESHYGESKYSQSHYSEDCSEEYTEEFSQHDNEDNDTFDNDTFSHSYNSYNHSHGKSSDKRSEESDTFGEEQDTVGEMDYLSRQSRQSSQRYGRRGSGGRIIHHRTRNKFAGGGGGSGGANAGNRLGGINSGINHVTQTRQRMPLEGGYGGMFGSSDIGIGSGGSVGSHSTDKSDGTSIDNESKGSRGSQKSHKSGISQSSAASAVSAVSSLSGSIFSLASNFFTKPNNVNLANVGNASIRGGRTGQSIFHRTHGTNNIHGTNGTHGRRTTHLTKSSTCPSDDLPLPKYCIGFLQLYLRLPFRLRYFLQMFSICGVFLLASLNYFIVMEGAHQLQHAHNGADNTANGSRNLMGGMSLPIPRLRVHTPFEFLHPGNGSEGDLFHAALAKLRESHRFKFLLGDGANGANGADGPYDPSNWNSDHLKGGPFSYGWKSMPRQIFNDFPTGLSDDTKVIPHPNSAEGQLMRQQQQLMESGEGKEGPPRRKFGSRIVHAVENTFQAVDKFRNKDKYVEPLHQQPAPKSNTLGKLEGLSSNPSSTSKLPAKGTIAYVLPITTCYPPLDPSTAQRTSRSLASSSNNGINSQSLLSSELHQLNIHPQSTHAHAPTNEDAFRDFAVMLRSMIHAQSWRNPASGSLYDYEMVALVHPQAKRCSDNYDTSVQNVNGYAKNTQRKEWKVDRSVLLQNLGYHVQVVESPIKAEQLQNTKNRNYLTEYLDQHPTRGRSDSLADLIRLHAYTLEEYDAVVLVDYDTLVLGAADEAFDLITEGGSGSDGSDKNDGNIGNDGNESIDAVFSWEHVPSLNVSPTARASVVNLSFFLLRPSQTTFQLLLSTYLNAPFHAGKGWGDIGRGSFPGWMTTQGFLTYFYDEVGNANKVEMNRCSFGNTGESYASASSVHPGNTRGAKNGDSHSNAAAASEAASASSKSQSKNVVLITNGGKVECGSTLGPSSSQCNDCSKTKLEDIFVADLSYCSAPWECGGDGGGGGDSSMNLSAGLCRKFHQQWFGGRLQMEDVHPQLQKGSGKLCIDGEYQPMQVAQVVTPES